MSILSSTATGMDSVKLTKEELVKRGYQVHSAFDGKGNASNENFCCDLYVENRSLFSGQKEEDEWYTYFKHHEPPFNRGMCYLHTIGELSYFEEYWKIKNCLLSEVSPEEKERVLQNAINHCKIYKSI